MLPSFAGFDAAVNQRWLEALDVNSGRIYFMELELNAAGDVRPTGQTSWEAPPGFLVRREMIMYLQSALQALEDDAFLAKVRDRFPPPSTGTPAEREVMQLRARVAELEASRAELASRVEAAEAQQVPTWKRGASSKFAPGTVEQPPPPPAWMLANKTSSMGSSMGLYG